MKAFLKENSVLIAGIALPIILTLVFFISTQITRMSVNPPQYSVIYATDYPNYNNQNPYKFSVRDHKLHFIYTPPTDEKNNTSWNKPRLFLYSPITQKNREINVPDMADEKQTIDVVISDLSNLSLIDTIESPDGYVFLQDYDNNGNLMTEIFGGGYRSHNRYVLKTQGRRDIVPAPYTNGYYYYNTAFVAWVESEGDTK